ncbi:MAG: TIGR00266 family protein [Chloroflexota bacterium]
MADNTSLTGVGGGLPPRLDTTVEHIQTEYQGGPGRISYRIDGTTMQVLTVQVEEGEVIYTESGNMSWMSDNMEMKSHTGGGLGKLIKRAFSGESLFIVDYFVNRGTGIVAFANEFPGKIIPFDLGPGESVIMQKDAFMAAEKSVDLDISFRKKLGAGFFGGEGFIMQKATGPGLVFAEIDGEVVEYQLEAGQTLKVDTGHVAMFEPTVDFDVTIVKGFRNILMGGEGLFLSTLRGPGRVWLQTMPITNLAKKVFQFAPASSGGGGDGNGFNIGNILDNL